MINLLEAVKKQELEHEGGDILGLLFLITQNVKDTGLEHPKTITMGEICIVRSFVKRKKRKYVLGYGKRFTKDLNEDEFRHHLDVLQDCCIPLHDRINMEAIFTNAQLEDCQYLVRFSRHGNKYAKCVVVDERTISMTMNPEQAFKFLPHVPSAISLCTFEEEYTSHFEEDKRIELMHRITPTIMSWRILE
ncbi:hypothetical protein ACOMCU_01335 [Lysinibacillus sp. UGB7]|uniref:hypothetical protein n=1 Tax=Lysinibacillus sp. UGB7 TaxID=3411039 RepID=UPI003B7F9A8B